MAPLSVQREMGGATKEIPCERHTPCNARRMDVLAPTPPATTKVFKSLFFSRANVTFFSNTPTIAAWKDAATSAFVTSSIGLSFSISYLTAVFKPENEKSQADVWNKGFGKRNRFEFPVSAIFSRAGPPG